MRYFVYHGNMFSRYSYFCNELIKQGAKLVTNIDDIKEAYTVTYYVSDKKGDYI